MTAWQHRAACAGHPDPDLFTNGHRIAEAARYCQRCPVVAQCTEAGIGTVIGTWGGVFHKARSAGVSMTAAYLEEHGTPAAYRRHLSRNEQPCQRCTTANLFDWHERERLSPQKRKSRQQPVEV